MEDKVYFKIGEIADMYDTSIRALRLYDKIGLFRPEHTDENTGYRYYTIDQFPILNAILVLKGIGVRLADIKTVVDAGISPQELSRVLGKTKEYWSNRIEVAKFNIENIEKILSAANAAQPPEGKPQPDAYLMARLVCLENTKVEGALSEALWL